MMNSRGMFIGIGRDKRDPRFRTRGRDVITNPNSKMHDLGT